MLARTCNAQYYSGEMARGQVMVLIGLIGASQLSTLDWKVRLTKKIPCVSTDIVFNLFDRVKLISFVRLFISFNDMYGMEEFLHESETLTSVITFRVV